MARKTKTDMSELWKSSTFYGGSAAWLESMYEIYLSAPDKLEARWRLYFDGIPASDQLQVETSASSKSTASVATGRGHNGNGDVMGGWLPTTSKC